MLPAAFAVAFAVATVLFFGVSVGDVAIFAAYVGFGIALPGVLWVRALHAGDRTAAEEIALGLTCGYAVEVFCYIGARAVGMPLLVVIWPITTYVLFLGIPKLRGHWRGGCRRSTPPVWYSWSLALAFGYLVAWGAATYFRPNALTWPGLGTFVNDVPFHLALIGELKHHMPPTLPMVAGEPLLYHWFVYAHLAAASWITGLEPLVLLIRLAMLPMLAALVVLIGMTARRVIGLWGGASLAVVGSIFVAIPSLYLGSNGSFTWGGIPDLAWTSPTQTFGALLFAGVVLLLIDTYRHRAHALRQSLLTGVLLLAVMGAKAIFVPMLAVGLLAVAAVEIVRRRRPSRPTVTALAITTGCFLYAQLVLFGGVREAVIVAPLYFVQTSWGELTGLGELAVPPPGSLLALTMVCLLGLLITWSGILGLLSRPRSLLRPPLVLMLGIGAVGFGTALLLGHPARSQLFFLWGAYPYLVIVAVCGIFAVVRRAGLSRRATIAAVCAGLVAAYLIPLLCGVRVPLRPGQSDAALIRPYVVLLVIAVVVAVVAIAALGRLRAAAVLIVMSASIGLLADAHAFVLSHLPGRGPGAAEQAQVVPPGAMTAGRWLRAHSDPDELVATNAHCLWGREVPCDSRHFWVAALSERRVLVEGWAFSSTSQDRWRPGESVTHLPFWDERRFAANEAAFSAPSATSIGALRERYGVRWLFVDERLTGAEPGIGKFADLRFRTGDYVVYRVRDGASSRSDH
ncbi:hypothetical protein Misp02_10190 [Microtetraspora sp. NBRC 16547]|nr:hypothetical protein Misp02_10190 [Microtetraspora sp. NBRC 16547]